MQISKLLVRTSKLLNNPARAYNKDYSHNFDWSFETKLPRGHFASETRSFMKVLDEEVDTKSDQYLQNYDDMMILNNQVDEFTQQVMRISI
jgi:hypothetical protein